MEHPSLQMNWGVPDWHDEEAYPNPDDLTLTEWRWEFLRRTNDYREDFLLHVEEELKRHRSVTGEEHPVAANSPDFCPRMLGSERKYGVYYLRNPAASGPGLGQFARTYGRVFTDVTRGVLPKLLEEDQRIVITFDLTKPIQPQLDTAKEIFERHQRGESVIIRPRRRHRVKWSLYLRVIDARDAGATWEEIGEIILLPDPDETPQGDYDSQVKENLAQSAHAIWRQAQELKDNFPS